MTKTRQLVARQLRQTRLYCPEKDCGASCANNSKERGRFLRRHSAATCLFQVHAIVHYETDGVKAQ